MKTPLQLLAEIQIASPCPVPWEEMEGNDRFRHCAQCDKQVYDLSAMTADDAIALIREKEGDLCVQLYRRRDGTVLTADCPIGATKILRSTIKRVFSFAASIAAFLLFSGCESAKEDADAKNGKIPQQTGRFNKENCIRLGGAPKLPPPPPK